VRRTVALVLCAAAWALAATELPKSLSEIVASERTFAATCAQIGIRDSFLKFFSDDVITFGPELRRGVSYLKERPPDGPDGPKLWWEPVYGDVSAAGDLGYDTGPSIYTAKDGKKYYGMFFSVWQKQPNGEWKVILDAGLETPKPESEGHREFQAARQLEHGAKVAAYDTGSARASLASLEQTLASLAESEGLGKALLAHADSNLRLHRNKLFPIAGASDVRDYLAKQDASYRLDPQQLTLSSSGDLAYAVGQFKKKVARAGLSEDEGYYVRIWQRDAKGGWVIGLDSMLPLKR